MVVADGEDVGFLAALDLLDNLLRAIRQRITRSTARVQDANFEVVPVGPEIDRAVILADEMPIGPELLEALAHRDAGRPLEGDVVVAGNEIDRHAEIGRHFFEPGALRFPAVLVGLEFLAAVKFVSLEDVAGVDHALHLGGAAGVGVGVESVEVFVEAAEMGVAKDAEFHGLGRDDQARLAFVGLEVLVDPGHGGVAGLPFRRLGVFLLEVSDGFGQRVELGLGLFGFGHELRSVPQSLSSLRSREGRPNTSRHVT